MMGGTPVLWVGGYPIPGLDGGGSTPFQVWMVGGTLGTPHHDWMGYPSPTSIASTCYVAGGMLLAFMQDYFLVKVFECYSYHLQGKVLFSVCLSAHTLTGVGGASSCQWERWVLPSQVGWGTPILLTGVSHNRSGWGTLPLAGWGYSLLAGWEYPPPSRSQVRIGEGVPPTGTA